jgi:hypothetical protein
MYDIRSKINKKSGILPPNLEKNECTIGAAQLKAAREEDE